MVVKVDVERKQVDDAFDNCRVRALMMTMMGFNVQV